MKSYQLVEINQPLELVETENPEPQGTEVLIRITASGVCHSDLYFWQGGYDMGGGKKISIKEEENNNVPKVILLVLFTKIFSYLEFGHLVFRCLFEFLLLIL